MSDKPREKSRLRRSISRWANAQDQESRDLLKTYVQPGRDKIAEAQDREVVRLRGTLRTVTLTPRGGVPSLEAELYDGSGSITLVWLGRRRIVGIDPGVSISVEGRIGLHEDRRIMFNPRYELIPS
ncbi:OB-fold nucleic acid binding domain-containing protein [Nocardioides acrostichi]|uniref:OB-fold nucleic acid binding domain-containing protein n=1 Tax=Nocardioides acrostichi TaxID=2784339 RepID=UPI002E2D9BEE|nr:OB-fold nucleic acid binding domain-containing protein [Nocardioides acrostichi]